MTVKSKLAQQNPLIMRCHRLMEAFAKSDDERDFYLDRQEGFLVYVDLDKSQDELEEVEKELKDSSERYCPIPKLTFYEIKKLMEGFVNEKVYDIDTKEKLIDIIQSKEARENFLEFIYDHHSELEKWQQYYQERFRVRIIEWLRNNQFDFVFEEDLEMTKSAVEKLKLNTFTPKVGKDVASSRKLLFAKAKTYYSSEALNPRPKRGRPPKQVAKVETEPQFSGDIYLTIPKSAKPFLFVPEYHGASIFTFSGKFASEADLIAHKRASMPGIENIELQSINQKIATLRTLSSHWLLGGKEGSEKEKEVALRLDGVPKASTLAKKPIALPLSADEIAFKEPSRKRELKAEKQLEESFFRERSSKGGKEQKLSSQAMKATKEKAKGKIAIKTTAKIAPKMAAPKVAGKAQGKAQDKAQSKAKSMQPFKMPANKMPNKAQGKAIFSKSALRPATSKSVAGKTFSSKQSNVKGAARVKPKARLRPLVKKASPKPIQKEKVAPTKKQASLRLLRRSKKK